MIKKIEFTNIAGYAPTKGYKTDSGWDLYINEDAVIMPGQFMDIHTGIAVHMDEGIWAMITGRSSTGRKHGLRVETGIIDNGYTGELFIGIWNITEKPINVSKGMRLAQLIFFNRVDTEWELVSKLGTTERGTSGFGSTGTGKNAEDVTGLQTLVFMGKILHCIENSYNGTIIIEGIHNITIGSILDIDNIAYFVNDTPYIDTDSNTMELTIKKLGEHLG